MKKIQIRIGDLFFTQRQIFYILIHIVLLIAITFIWAHLTWNYPKIFGIPIAVASWVGVGVVLFSLADYLDLIEFRKSHQRFTKCIVCDRTSKVNKFNEKSMLVTNVRKEGHDEEGDLDSEIRTEKVVTKSKPDLPLHGVIVYDKMICTECLKYIQEMNKA